MNSTTSSEYKVYGYRWVVLLLFGFVTLINQIIWITFAAITPKAMSFYGQSKNAIFWFSLVFMIVYIPMNIPAALALDKFGLKWGTGIGVVLTGVFGILRAVSTHYHWVLIFQIGVALGQPFLLNSFTKVSSNWFAAEEKALATSLGTAFVLIGVLLGMLITPFLVPGTSLTLMLYIYGGVALGLMVIVISFWGTLQRYRDVDPLKFALAAAPDIQAAAWIKENVSTEALFLVNSFFAFNDSVVVGSDGGWWLPITADRQTTLPPITYNFEMEPFPDYSKWVQIPTRMIEAHGITHPTTVETLKEYGVTHIYIGQQQGSVNYSGPLRLNPVELSKDSHFNPIYQQDCVWIFEFSP